MKTKSKIPYYMLNITKLAKQSNGSLSLFWKILLAFTIFIFFYGIWSELNKLFYENNTRVIVITPTYKRTERLPDLIKFSQTLMHIKNLHWIVVEDGPQTYPSVERIVQRTTKLYTYMSNLTLPNYPHEGWSPRNAALKFVREYYKNYEHNAVVYFGDDDNAYDLRLFNYIRKVKKVGIWAVGLAGRAIVEAPHVVNGVITSFDVIQKPERKFAVNFCGFAMNLKLVLEKDAYFTLECTTNENATESESCYLSQYGISLEDIEAFGYDDKPKEIMVWHTKTRAIPVSGSNYGYVTE